MNKHCVLKREDGSVNKFMNAMKNSLQFSITGRLSRFDHLVFNIAMIAFMFIAPPLTISIGVADTYIISAFVGFILFVLIISITVFSVCASVRRLHDLNYSGWMYLIMLIPIVGFFFMLYLIFAKAKDENNRFN